jgi:hypothetical protein
MPRIDFAELPPDGRLWVFPSSRALSDGEARAILDAVDDFLAQWAAHGTPLHSGRALRHRRFLVVGVDVDAEAPSGCSIDALVNRLRALGSDLGLTLIDHAPVWYREGEEVRSVSRAEFRELAEQGIVGPATRVFDTSLTRIEQARDGSLERPAADTWHGRTFFKDRVGV